MTLTGLAARNVLRNRFRTVATIVGVAMTIVTFVLLRTIIESWTAGEEHAAKDRIATRHKISVIMPMPLRYVQEIQQTPGVAATALAQWFGGKDPNREDTFFATIAVRPKEFLTVYDEITLPEDQKRAWLEDRQGAIIGESLAKQMGWKVGDEITLKGTIFPGDWRFHVSGVYGTSRRSIDKSTLWFHWNYLNDSVKGRMKDQVGWIVSRIDNAGQSAQISKAIDAKFEASDTQTLTMSERQMNASFLGMLSAVLRAIDLVSVVILAIMMLILGNTIAMGVRERSHEYGVLRAIGFLPKHLVRFVLVEAMTIGLLGGLVGVGLGFPLVEQGMGRFLEENMGGIFPYVRVSATTTSLAMGLAVLLGAVAAIIPAYGASKLDVVDSLRRVG